jgi:outer membrane protein assembly factor BamB
MQNTRTKILTIFATAVLLSSITALMADAHTPPLSIPSYAFVEANPNPAGVGQTVNIGFWLGQPPPTAAGSYGDRWGNLTIIVTKPDGSKETLGPFISDDTGGTHTDYTPTTVGNYTIQFNFPGQTLAGNNLSPTTSAATKAFIGDYYQPANATTTLTVQESAIPPIPQTPLPANYWDRPIVSVNNYWYSISGNWLGLGTSTFANTGMYNITGNYNPYTTAPKTSHILWTKPVAFGGLMGGEQSTGDISNYYSTSQYEPKFAPVVINGVLYYTEYPGSNQDPTGIIAVDLRTGKTLWEKTGLNYTVPQLQQGQLGTAGGVTSTGAVQYTTSLRCGQVLNYISPNQFGGLAYLWVQQPTIPPNTGATYGLWDAMTGDPIMTIINAPAAFGLAPLILTESDSGDLIGYYINSTNPNVPTLNMWNSSQAILYPNGAAPGFQNWYWRPVKGSSVNFSSGIMWTVPLPTNISGQPLPSATSNPGTLGITTINSGVILMTAAGFTGGSFFQSGYQIEAGYNANTGQQLWITNRTETPYTRIGVMSTGYNVYTVINYETGALVGYSLNSGTQLWTTQLANPNAYNSIGGYQHVLANGIMYLWGFGGDIWAIDMQTGKVNWQTTTNTLQGPAGSDTPYGVWPLWTFTCGSFADNILFVPEGHMYSPPLFRGAKELAINATDGTLVWSILGFDVTSGPAIADGIMATLNAYDNQIYAFGKGATKITVNAPNVGVTTSAPITISGTVIDLSDGSQQNAVAKNFPNGLPVISDASMEQFMEAVYMQQPMPMNLTGVPISINVLDSNGNYRTIGTTTSKADGTFAFTWTPDITGDYTVYATFDGTQSYYASAASAAFHASEAAIPAPGTTGTTGGLATTNDLILYMAIGVIAIIIAIAIVGALILRRRP